MPNDAKVSLDDVVRRATFLRAVRVDGLAVFPGRDDPPTPPVAAPLVRIWRDYGWRTAMRGAVDSFWAMAERRLAQLGVTAATASRFVILETVPVTCTVLGDGRARYEWEFGVYVEGEHR